jgi:hypothetical protein
MVSVDITEFQIARAYSMLDLSKINLDSIGMRSRSYSELDSAAQQTEKIQVNMIVEMKFKIHKYYRSFIELQVTEDWQRSVC